MLQQLMNFYIVLFITFLTAIVTSTSPIKPLYATTLELDDNIIRKNLCIFRTLPLPFNKDRYQASSSINVVGSISQLSINQGLAFQLKYQILCPENVCFIDFVLSRFTEKVSDSFEYKIAIDFLVAEQLMVTDFNMTFYKADLSINPKSTKNEKDTTGVIVKDEWQVYLLPNGFNNVTMTGYVSQSIDPTLQKLILHYEDFSLAKQDAGFMRWGLNKNFILYKVVIVPKRALTSDEECQHNNVLRGFLSTKQASINFNFHQQKKENIKYYEQFQLSMDCLAQFKDDRKPVEFVAVQTEAQTIQTKYFYAIIPLLIAEVGYILYKRHQSAVNKNSKLPDLIISFQLTQITSHSEMTNIEKCETKNELNQQKVSQTQK